MSDPKKIPLIFLTPSFRLLRSSQKNGVRKIVGSLPSKHAAAADDRFLDRDVLEFRERHTQRISDEHHEIRERAGFLRAFFKPRIFLHRRDSDFEDAEKTNAFLFVLEIGSLW